ncbi:zinc-binding dehydrogenase [Nocardia sp. NPDC049220]|uniref:zinc-binding dehydrogenase n=1 Tax=Nocardia sp. NPDC049220 TaxID=3155273 RepID=UPI0034069FE1
MLDHTKNGHGVEHVLEAVGMATLARSVHAAAYNARITVIGAMPAPGVPAGNPFGTSYLSIRKIAVGSRADFEAMNRSIAEHRMRPVIDRVFPFDRA